jgi:hypothetical protein
VHITVGENEDKFAFCSICRREVYQARKYLRVKGAYAAHVIRGHFNLFAIERAGPTADDFLNTNNVLCAQKKSPLSVIPTR